MIPRKTVALAACVVGCTILNSHGWQNRAANAQGIASLSFKVNVYSAKFLCGEYQVDDQPAREGPVKPGNYQTAINVHNPHSKPVTLRKKAVLVFDSTSPDTAFEVPKPPGPKFQAELRPDWALEIDCPDIRELLLAGLAPPAPAFIKGWVVLEVPANLPLDVTAAYSAHGFAPDALDPTLVKPEGFSLEVISIEPKQVTRTLTPGSEPRCGNGTINPGEDCDPPGSACPGNKTCQADCTCPTRGGPCTEPCVADPPSCTDGVLMTHFADCINGNCLKATGLSPCPDGASFCSGGGGSPLVLTTFEPACNENGDACGPPVPTQTVCPEAPPGCTVTCDAVNAACFIACDAPPP